MNRRSVATIPNFNILEFSFGEVPWRAALVDPVEQVTDGTLALANQPRLGIRLNEKTAAKYGIWCPCRAMFRQGSCNGSHHEPRTWRYGQLLR
jgi:hypothetical protein